MFVLILTNGLTFTYITSGYDLRPNALKRRKEKIFENF